MLNFDLRYAVIWDMDGVLVNTGEFHYQAWESIFNELGFPFSENQFKETFGMNNAGILEVILHQNLPPGQTQKISDRKERLFRQAVKGKAALLPGIANTLEAFSKWSLKQAIASSAPPQNIDVLVNELKISKYFDAIVSGSDIPGKPDPAVFLEAASQLDIRPENCIVIEDAIPGVQGAKNAGMKCIAVTTTNPAEALSKADLIFPDLVGLDQETFLELLK
ncbi:MAG: HAD family phosphatase [Anaerolineales bacterium]|nr:HAD family phosphatase [Anaerolineales bacterium]